MPGDRPPLHDSLTVLENENVYQNEDWWKSVVRYQHEDSDSNEVAVYLWNHDDSGWTRKNKYVIKTTEAWETDKKVVNHLWANEPDPVSDDEFPVSDYYSLAAGETIFQSDGWWKAIVKLDEKGSYETEEVMIYLWQEIDGDWRRRQKYTLKDPESWREELELIESVLDLSESSTTESSSTTPKQTSTTTGTTTEETTAESVSAEIEEFEQLNRELDSHLSDNPE